MVYHALLQGSNPVLPHCRWILYHLSHQGSPKKFINRAKNLNRHITIEDLQIANKYMKRCSMSLINQFSSVQLLSRVRLFAIPWIAAHQGSLSITNSWSLLKLMPIESVMPMQIKTTKRWNYASTRMVIKCWREWEKMGVLIYCLWEYKVVYPIYEAVGKLL